MNLLADLRAEMPQIRDQGRRPSCLAIAASDAHQLQTSVEILSAEYLFYHACANGDDKIEDGLSFSDIAAVLTTLGQPEESVWPYQKSQPPTKDWFPPSGAHKLFRASFVTLSADPAVIFQAVEKQKPVVLGLVTRDSFFGCLPSGYPPVVANDIARGHHAVVTVALARQEQMYFGIRNSWGSGWGDNGHAWLSEAYLRENLFAAAIIEKVGVVA